MWQIITLYITLKNKDVLTSSFSSLINPLIIFCSFLSKQLFCSILIAFNKTCFTLAVTVYEGGSVNDTGDTHNENVNVSVTAIPETDCLVCKKLV